jgi:hypothetical protein
VKGNTRNTERPIQLRRRHDAAGAEYSTLN